MSTKLKLIESINLYCNKGTSDKIYQVNLFESESTYYVTTAYGKRTARSLITDVQSKSTNFSTCKAAFNQIITAKQKRAKGYFPGDARDPQLPHPFSSYEVLKDGEPDPSLTKDELKKQLKKIKASLETEEIDF